MYPHLRSLLYGVPWAILPDKLEALEAFAELKARGGIVSAEDVQRITASRRDDGVQMVGRVALVSCFGVISQRIGGLERASGGVSAEELGVTLDGLAADKSVRCICMVYDSPGGSVFGIEELGRKIASIAKEKKVIAQADSLMASAAYWLGSQASELCVTPGGQVGSIGVIAAHEDRSKRAETKGVKTTLVTSSKYKGEGNPDAPLSDDAREDMQSKVDAYHAMFVGAVARGRGVSEAKVNSDFGQGRMMTAKQAVAAGMADKVATLEQTLSRLGAFDGGGTRAESRAPAIAATLAAVRARELED